MSKLIVTKYKNKILQAFIQDKTVTDLYVSDDSTVLGSIYVGRVANIVENINACFVDYGGDRPCYYSIGDNHTIYADGKEHDRLREGDEILVQISRDGVGTKNPVGSSALTLRGKYSIVHIGGKVGVSAKITDRNTSDRLRKLAADSLIPGYGCIVRTAAAGSADRDVAAELSEFSTRLHSMVSDARTRKCGSCLHRSFPEYLEIISFVGDRRISEFVTDDADIYGSFLAYARESGISWIKPVLYDDDKCPLRAVYNLSRELENALKERVWLKSGAYLVIQQTEAMVVVDVNTGKAMKHRDIASHMLAVNMEAAAEVCRQLRLRGLSGIIMIDFINMKDPSAIDKVRDVLINELAKDPVPAKYVDTTRLGLIELTRKKIRKSLSQALGDC